MESVSGVKAGLGADVLRWRTPLQREPPVCPQSLSLTVVPSPPFITAAPSSFTAHMLTPPCRSRRVQWAHEQAGVALSGAGSDKW